MEALLIALGLVTILHAPAPIYLEATTSATSTIVTIDTPESPPPWTKERIRERIRHYSEKYAVSYSVMDNVVSCETAGTYDPLIQSGHYKNGVREESYGLSQINLPSHPHITKEQARNVEFSLNFMGEEMAAGRYWKWTCWRNIYLTKI